MTSGPGGHEAAAARAARRRALAERWDKLVKEVRGLDGFGGFLSPPRLPGLLPAAEGGPVVTVNISRWRCDALLVTRDGARAVPLPEVTLTAVAERTVAYLEALHLVDWAADDLAAARERYEREGSPASVTAYSTAALALHQAVNRREPVLAALLEWLWDVIAEPVLTALGLVEPRGDDPDPPRLWWCPTGLLTLLPLHGAGYHAAGDGRTVLDRAVSSYTPTLRALARARRPAEPRTGKARMLVVAVPDGPGQAPLADAARDRDMLTSRFPGACTLLEGADATVAAVRAELARHTWVHFSCHGDQDLGDPSQGGLALHDDVLRVAEVGVGRHGGEFAFLAACKTAIGGAALPDETITLAAALHHGGYRHVLGTLWSVRDGIAADVAESVYADLCSSGSFDPSQSARALHRATRSLRDDRRLPPSAWTPFTHTGP
ncbi:CHAT domain-containing protein [Actinomadura roseirufa]|uniref:CHAT domain-containing protein n=1 Tax=Actinomadura roseirufa TaxID=2094049 RepID=UPI0013F17B6E|nr:CHAT domain-containing protein [Actinomadura roseirufa]